MVGVVCLCALVWVSVCVIEEMLWVGLARVVLCILSTKNVIASDDNKNRFFVRMTATSKGGQLLDTVLLRDAEVSVRGVMNTNKNKYRR